MLVLSEDSFHQSFISFILSDQLMIVVTASFENMMGRLGGLVG